MQRKKISKMVFGILLSEFLWSCTPSEPPPPATAKETSRPTQEQPVQKPPEPCWAVQSNCEGQPGYIYFVGASAIQGNGGLSTAKIVAETLAQQQYSHHVKTQIDSQVGQSTRCQTMDGIEHCKTESESTVLSSSKIVIRPTDYEVSDSLAMGGQYYVRLKVKEAYIKQKWLAQE